MSTKSIFSLLGVLCLIAAAVMYFIGKESSHLSEMKEFWWLPLPVGVIFIWLATRPAQGNK
ncbi:MAG: hypothetical protein N2747_10920 [Chitinophagaceae bacterium]|nr:hypothetical protein [Chitinophagaceae bacterium]